MDEKKRSDKDLEKLKEIMNRFREYKLDKKYSSLFEHCLNYKKDAEHYHSKKDYFSSFGCSNYAYGILEGLLFLEKGKLFHECQGPDYIKNLGGFLLF